MRRLIVPRTLLAAFLVAAPVTVLPASPAQAAGTHQVLMSGYAFSPRSLTITAGDTVTWTNRDQAPHDVKTTSGPASVHSPMLNKGGSWSHTFTTAGTYGYVCTVHPGMTAQLVVEPAAAPTTRAPVHEHHTSAPAAVPTERSTAASTPAMTMDHSAHTTKSAAAAAPASQAPSPTAPAAQPALGTQNAASATRPLQPLLLLTGVVAGVAVLCLLLVGSRSAAATGKDDPSPS
ncbi:plastocyanin/azurin family copper-binding protein [Streptomyces sp. NPDC001401]|uniref:cupredoxin domain-containing protein n=1 Tax=Streptomyces sp. NPDC001401 TaxID=3364570 RepID=UPI0036C12F3A